MPTHLPAFQIHLYFSIFCSIFLDFCMLFFRYRSWYAFCRIPSKKRLCHDDKCNSSDQRSDKSYTFGTGYSHPSGWLSAAMYRHPLFRPQQRAKSHQRSLSLHRQCSRLFRLAGSGAFRSSGDPDRLEQTEQRNLAAIFPGQPKATLQQAVHCHTGRIYFLAGFFRLRLL